MRKANSTFCGAEWPHLMIDLSEVLVSSLLFAFFLIPVYSLHSMSAEFGELKKFCTSMRHLD